MSVQMQSRTWPKIFAARGDGPGKGISPIYATASRRDIPYTGCEHGDAGKPHKEFGLQIEEMFKETVREQGFSSRKSGKKQARINDEEALAGMMKEISSEVESFQSLYDNHWFSNKSKASHGMKPKQDSTKPDALANIIKLDEFPVNVRSGKDKHFTKEMLNKPSMRDMATQNLKLKIREHDIDLESELSKLNLSQKTAFPSRSHEECTTNEKQVQEKAVNMSSPVVRTVNALTDTERQDFKKAVGVISTKVTQAENVGTTLYNNIAQARTSGEANRPLHSEGTEAQSETDDSVNALTDAERQTFKDAINAMNAETEREEKREAKASSKSLAAHKRGLSRTSKEHRKSAGATEKTAIWSSSRIERVDVKKYNRQSGAGKVVQSQSAMNNPQGVRRVSDVHADKQKTAVPEPLVKRETQEKQKAAIYHNLPHTKPKSLSSIPNIKNGNFQAGFVKPVPLETGVLHVSPSVPLVSKHHPRKTMPPITSQSKFQKRHVQVK